METPLNHTEIEISPVPDVRSLRYILFLIDSKHKEHDGKIFCSHRDALEYAHECIKEKHCDKAVIGMFCINPNAEEMFISMVETIDFK